MPSPPNGDTLDRLRRSCGSGKHDLCEAEAPLPFGLPTLDLALQGGLAYGALHELAPVSPAQLGAALGFGLALAARTSSDRRMLFMQTEFAARESGLPYGPGLDAFGLPMQRVILLRLPRPVDLLGAFEDVLKSHAIALALADLPEAAVDLTATRRLSLAARAGGGLGLLLRHKPCPDPSAAMTR